MASSFFSIALSIAAMVIGVFGLLALLAFGFWASRRADLRSLPWLGIFLVLNCQPFIFFNAWIIRRLTDGGEIFNSSAGGTPLTISGTPLIILLIGAQQLLSALTGVLLALLVMADTAHLIAQSDTAIDSAAVRGLMLARKYSFAIGLCAAVLALLWHLITLSYRV
jgi:hypothetical protein